MIQHIADQVLPWAAYVAAGYAYTVIRRFKIGREFLQRKGLAYDAVRYAEDLLKGSSIEKAGEKKFQHACNWLAKECKTLHLKTSTSQIEGLIRGAYTDFKKGFEQAEHKNATKTPEHAIPK